MAVGNAVRPDSESEPGLIERLFDTCFLDKYNTRLCGGGDEPVYLPAKDDQDYHRLIYRADYTASALHEVAHWCIAGPQRRRQVDFGYWYFPDGRSAQQQRAFEQMEVKPQALEWIFSEALGLRFQLSTDNLNGGGSSSSASADDFADLVFQQALSYCRASDRVSGHLRGQVSDQVSGQVSGQVNGQQSDQTSWQTGRHARCSLPHRAAIFVAALANSQCRDNPLQAQHFSRDTLR